MIGPATGSGSTDVISPPGDPVRGNRLFVRVDRWVATAEGWLARWLPHDLNPLARSGAAANLALMVATATGILLLVWYSPSVQFAYASLDAIRGNTLGGWVRAMHRYSSDVAMLLLFVHAGRTFVARKFAGSRWLPWLTGVLMMALVWFIGWTGYWLVWDQPAQQVAVGSMRLLDGLPIFGEPMARLFVADRLVPSLLFFVVFFLHMLLPLGIAIGLALHLARVSRVKLLPRWELSAALVAGMVFASLVVPAPLDEPADMALKATHFTVDAWYLTPLALGLRFQHAGLWVALFGTTALAALIPWLLGQRPPRTAVVARVDQSRCHSCSQCSQDCPFDAITLVARTDGKHFPSQASVDAEKCVGCGVCGGSCDSDGIYLPWFETRREEERIMGGITATMARGGAQWVAFICGDIDGGMATFHAADWHHRLPGYQVFPVPNASWVQPKFVERVLRHGIHGVLVVRDARPEAWSRDGGLWVAERLQRAREPRFRPERAEAGGWRVVDFDPSAPAALADQAMRFRKTGLSGVVNRNRTRGIRWIVMAIVAATVTAASVAPSRLRVTNPAPDDPEFVFSFKAFGDRAVSAAPQDDGDKPIHMRGRSTEKPSRSPVTVRIHIDGAVRERVFGAKGISHDGPAIDEWRVPLTPGRHDIAVEVATGPDSEPLRWSETVEALPRRYVVVTYDPSGGFRLE